MTKRNTQQRRHLILTQVNELGEVADSRSGKSEKELSISQFKSGFCTKRLPLLMFCKGNS